jgi:hypothetical protein
MLFTVQVLRSHAPQELKSGDQYGVRSLVSQGRTSSTVLQLRFCYKDYASLTDFEIQALASGRCSLEPWLTGLLCCLRCALCRNSSRDT